MTFIRTNETRKGLHFTVCGQTATSRRGHISGPLDTYEEALAFKEKIDRERALAKTGAKDEHTAVQALQTLREYFYDESFTGYRARAKIEANTWVGYEGIMRLHVLPALGQMSVITIKKRHVQQMLDQLERMGRSQVIVHRSKTVLSAVMGTLLDEDVIEENPCHGAKTVKPMRKPKRVMSDDEFNDLRDNLPTNGAQTLALFLLETGARYGEATAITCGDIDLVGSSVCIKRAVADVGDANNPDKTGRFQVKSTKSGHFRFRGISSILRDEIVELIEEFHLDKKDLVFSQRTVMPPVDMRRPSHLPDVELTADFIETLGLTEPNAKGARYQHGHISGYTNGKCRCDWCRMAMRQNSRKAREAKRAKKVASHQKLYRGPRTNATGHLPKDAWYTLWNPACEAAGISKDITTHCLRHTFATKSLQLGENLEWVKTALGHSDISVTQIYLHEMQDKDNRANEKMAQAMGIRRRKRAS